MSTIRLADKDLETLAELAEAHDRIRSEVGKVIVGQAEVLEQIVVCLLAGGHCLLVGVPGLGKTLLVSTLSNALNLKFRRIQFTPDLMPSDITGTDILRDDTASGRREFVFVRGPVFANIVLADEVNRTPPKTQAALLQAMQEHEVTAGGHTYRLDEPFFVLATQNPIEQEGTYPLPEAQLDRFMFNILVDYPSAAEEERIVTQTTSGYAAALEAVLDGSQILTLQRLVRRVPVADEVVRYAVGLVRSTRPSNQDSPQAVKRWVSWGAGPRASQYLILGAKTRAALHGKPTPEPEDVRAVALPVLRHRIVTNYAAEAEGVDAESLVETLLQDYGPTPF
jgi:MoxR-like ATPase